MMSIPELKLSKISEYVKTWVTRRTASRNSLILWEGLYHLRKFIQIKSSNFERNSKRWQSSGNSGT